MTQYFRMIALVVALGVIPLAQARAQDPIVPRPPVEDVSDLIPLRIEVVVSRYQGERLISRLPYTLSANANAAQVSQLRMGARVPVPIAPPPMRDGKPVPDASIGPVNYERIGTNIDCRARTTDDGRFQLELTIEDTSIYVDSDTPAGTPRVGNMPVFRSFQSTNTLILGDGQTTQFTAATDRITGEVVRVDVTLTVAQ